MEMKPGKSKIFGIIEQIGNDAESAGLNG